MRHTLAISLTAGALLGLSCAAYATNPHEPVWRDSQGQVVRDGQGECLKTMYWKTPNMIEACGGKVAPAPAPVRMAQPVTLRGDTSFRSGSSDLSPAARSEIADVAARIKQMSKVTAVRVAGHTDSSGPEAANQRLSEARANAVRNALVADGIDGALISATGYGESRPVADNATAAGRASNRRVEIEIDGY